jgi:site-specific DNA-adenine methylase
VRVGVIFVKVGRMVTGGFELQEETVKKIISMKIAAKLKNLFIAITNNLTKVIYEYYYHSPYNQVLSQQMVSTPDSEVDRNIIKDKGRDKLYFSIKIRFLFR